MEYHSVDVTKSTDELPQINDPIEGIVFYPGTINIKPLKSLKIEDFQNNFEVSVNYRFMGGRPYTPLDEEVYAQLNLTM